ncbi:UNVERIFIED_CONTAM: Peroxidase 17 [Sesamum angustifolium]|uniref:peroxidase n=1 Tax=Sesamum angustifolium TaxID=2727405 RepID=A0AAW2RN47_9LAMI
MPLTTLLLSLLLSSAIAAAAPPLLRPGFYSETCPEAESIVRDVLRRAMARETRSAASVMRLQFHDCLVNGCDGSLLLDDTATMVGEKLALSNVDSLRSYDVIDEAKEAVERACPGVVSCADVVIMAARDAVLLPKANATYLTNLFSKFNLTIKDLVALSGSHSIGKARCFSIVFRLYNQSGSGQPDIAIEPRFREKLNKLCPLGGDERSHRRSGCNTREIRQSVLQRLGARAGILEF